MKVPNTFKGVPYRGAGRDAERDAVVLCFLAKIPQLQSSQGILPESQGQNLTLTVLYVPNFLFRCLMCAELYLDCLICAELAALTVLHMPNSRLPRCRQGRGERRR